MTTTPQRPTVSNYRDALEAKLANLRFLETPDAIKTLYVAMGLVIGKDDEEEIVKLIRFWKAIGQYTEKEATPYFFSGDVCQLIAAGANALDDDYTLQPEDLPSPAGHFHYAHTFQTEQTTFTDPHEHTITTRLIGVSWITCNIDDARFRGGTVAQMCGMAPDKSTGILIITWSLADEYNLRPYGLPLSMHVWHFGDKIDAVYKRQEENSPTIKRLRTTVGYNPDYTECSIIAASLLFMQQTIIQVAEMGLNKREQKQLDRDRHSKGLNARLHVVHLRRRKTVKADGTEDDNVGEDEAHLENKKPVEWSHRWLVDGFWRNQPYPSLGVIKRIWINGFVKGPEDKPLKVKAVKVAAVVR